MHARILYLLNPMRPEPSEAPTGHYSAACSGFIFCERGSDSEAAAAGDNEKADPSPPASPACPFYLDYQSTKASDVLIGLRTQPLSVSTARSGHLN